MTQATRPTPSGNGSSLQGDREHLQLSFARDGYLVLRKVVSPEQLSSLHRRIIEEFELAKRSGALFQGGGTISGHLNCFPGNESRFAYEALKEHGVVDLVRTILPRPFETPCVGCNLNLPKSVAQHYHFDGTFMEDFMVVNIALMDTDLTNGAIDVIPGSHRQYSPYWRFALQRTYRGATRIPMRRGDVLIRTSRLWHRGMPNHSAAPRPMLALTFGEKQNEVQRRDPFQINDGKIRFYENWFRPSLLGRLRERTFVLAPFTYSSYRIVSSLLGNTGYSKE